LQPGQKKIYLPALFITGSKTGGSSSLPSIGGGTGVKSFFILFTPVTKNPNKNFNNLPINLKIAFQNEI